MLKIKQKNCRFKVDESKHTIVCWVEGNTIRYMVDSFLKEHNIDIFGMRPNFHGVTNLENIVYLPWKVTGVATCQEGDIWNEELGKLIAFNKMKTKLMKLFFKHLQNSVDYIADVVENMSQAADAVGMRFETELARRNNAIEAELKRNETISAD